MIRALVEQTFDQQKKYFVLAGSSSDVKPTAGLITGSEFHEVDTGLKYQFDEASATWNVVGLTPDEIKAEIDAWLDDHPEATTTVQDGAITYAKLNSSLQGTVDEVGDLKSAIDEIRNDNYIFNAIAVDATAAGWRLNESDGLCSSDASYKLVKFKVTAGAMVKVVSTDRFQFQTVASVPSSGSNNRVGQTYGIGTFVIKVPDTATYLIMSAATADTPSAYTLQPAVKELQTDVEELQSDYHVLGTDYDLALGTWENGAFVSWNKRMANRYAITIGKGDVVNVVSPTLKYNIGITTEASPTADIQTTGWEDPSSQNYQFVSEYDGNMHIVFSKTNGDTMQLSDYDATVIIYNTTIGKITSLDILTSEKFDDVNDDLQHISTAIRYTELPTLLQGIGLAGNPVNLPDLETRDYYIAYDGSIQQSNSFAYTSGINLKKGQTIALWAKGYNQAVGMISTYADNTYMVVSVSRDSSVGLYLYTATADCVVALSYDYNIDHSAYISGKLVQTIEEHVSNELSFAGEVYGKYIGTGGEIQSGANDFRYTPPISIKAGQTVVLNGAGYNQAVTMIAKYNGEGLKYTPLVVSSDSNVNAYSYHCFYDMQIAFSYNKTKDHSAYWYIDNQRDPFSLIDYSVLFPKVSVIGDSLSSGHLYINGSGTDYYGDSWLSFIARKCGLQRNHYSKGGLTTKTWLEEYATKLQSDEASNAYFIALGTNDDWFHPYEMGTVSDTAGTNTFAGYYKQIIELVRTKAPNAAIFCISKYKTSTDWNALIQAIANLYSNVYYIDIPSNSSINPDTGGVWSAGSHFTTLGYCYIANVILNQVDDIVKHNGAAFKFFGQYNSVGSQYDF